MDNRKKKAFTKLVLGSFLFVFFLLISSGTHAGAVESSGTSLYLSPSAGTYAVGDIITASVFINTGGRSINAIQADLHFPPDKLQVISPSAGRSVIDVWVGQPAFSNTNGTINFRGAIPNPGLNVSQGLISTISFRVKSTGKAVVSFEDSSQALLNDGKGTNVLSSSSGGIFDLVLPPPEGPVVVSSTHPDQSAWYKNGLVSLEWRGGAESDTYSYILDDEPVSTPDDITDTSSESVTYRDVPDGVHYFHIRAHRGGVWGGTTHYSLQIDKTPPADFDLGIEPHKTTADKHPIITFDTTDQWSGLDHYELKLIPLSFVSGNQEGNKSFFIETKSPYVPDLTEGKYDIVLRAFDRAGNIREVNDRLTILSPSLQAIEWLVPTSVWGSILLLLLFLLSAYIYHRSKIRHLRARALHAGGPMFDKEIARKLAKLNEYQKRYGSLVLMIFMALGLLFVGSAKVRASDFGNGQVVEPPLITTLPTHITNEELFYVGGRHPDPGSVITIYLENADTGETFSQQAITDKNGDWFYSRDKFLPVGEYLIWAQAKSGNISSPPTGRESIKVEATAIKLGGTHISYEFLYLFIASLFMLATLILLARALHHHREAKHRHVLLKKEIEEAEESIHRGFALVRRDIETILTNMEHRKNNTQANRDELEKEKALLGDLRSIEETIGKEVWDIRTNAL